MKHTKNIFCNLLLDNEPFFMPNFHERTTALAEPKFNLFLYKKKIAKDIIIAKLIANLFVNKRHKIPKKLFCIYTLN